MEESLRFLESPRNGIDNEKLLEKTAILTISITFSLTLSVFPFYLFLYLKNRQRDKNKPVSQITSFFHTSIFIFYTLFILQSISMYVYDFIKDNIFLSLLFATLYIAPTLILGSFSQVNQCILIIFAWQKFLFYFIPNAEKYLKISNKALRRIAVLLLFPFFVDVYISNLCIDSRQEPYLNFLVMGVSGVLNGSLVVLTIGYFILLISIRNSKDSNNPKKLKLSQKYLFWMLFVFYLVKVIIATISYFLFLHDHLLYITIIDRVATVLITPLVIELVYIICNFQDFNCQKRRIRPT
ncbi:hypothetical protein CAEBREN_14605 [Caenorhabditis brenneri]|uniref:Serpentine receptor class gamma n=1 Tax=Caenorhabditis brenneri TaxID=135651 RepID=G0PJH1_CAEBE|nr:hypothetical protein CAEBREN_14605 [Caenorhabditis brenneri]